MFRCAECKMLIMADRMSKGEMMIKCGVYDLDAIRKWKGNGIEVVYQTC